METSEMVLSVTGQPLVEISARPDPYRTGWSSVAVNDITGWSEQRALFTRGEWDALVRLLAEYAGWADAQLEPEAFPRPAVDGLVVDPIPDRLATRLVPLLVDRLGRIFRDRPGPVPDAWVSIHQALDAVLLELSRYGQVVDGSIEADTLREVADRLIECIVVDEVAR